MDNEVDWKKFMRNNIIWPAVAAGILSAVSILTSVANPDLAIAIGLAAITNAVLATRI